MPLRDELGKIIRWHGEITDIDDQKRAEEVLKERALLLDLTQDGVFVRDVNEAITGSSRCRPVDKEPANRHARAPRNPRPHARVIHPRGRGEAAAAGCEHDPAALKNALDLIGRAPSGAPPLLSAQRPSCG